MQWLMRCSYRLGRLSVPLCVCLVVTATLLPAAAVKKNKVKFSFDVGQDCLKHGGSEKACAALALAADPPGDGITY